MRKLNERTHVYVVRNEANFDRACDSAWRQALMLFGADEYGYLLNVDGFERTTDTLNVEFYNYTRHGVEHEYTFTAWVSRNEDD